MTDEAVLLADGFEEAFIGLGHQFTTVVAVYDYDLCLSVLIDRDGMTADEAEEWMSYNVEGAYVGPTTPIFLHRKTLAEALEELHDTP